MVVELDSQFNRNDKYARVTSVPNGGLLTQESSSVGWLRYLVPLENRTATG